MIGTEEYQYDENLDKVIPTREEYQQEDIDRHWLKHTEEYTIRNKQYKDEDKGGYTINKGSFDIESELGRFINLW